MFSYNVPRLLSLLLIITKPSKTTSETSIYCNIPSECIINHIQSLNEDRFSSEILNRDSVEHIKFENSNFEQFPENLLAGFSNLERVTAYWCGLQTLDVSTFGENQFLSNLKVVDLQANEITEIGPKTFARLHHLRSLYLGYNRIMTIDDDGFYGLEELEVLNLTQNLIVSLHINIFAGLQSLFQIDLDKNELFSFDFDIFEHNEQLFHVHLSENKMTDIQSSIVNEKIQQITLSKNELFDISALNNMKGMKRLWMSDNTNLQLHSQVFTDMSQLTHLYMYGTNLQRLENDFSLFTSLRSLEVLAIGRNSLYSLAFTHFPNLSSLSELTLNDNGLSSLDVYRLKENFPVLAWMVIGNNNWDCGYLKQLTDDMTGLGINVWHNILDELGNDKSVEITDASSTSIAGIGCTERPKEWSDPRLTPTNNQICGKPVLFGSSFIYGGMTTSHGAWPWIVVINMRSDDTIKYVCGASLLSNKVAISAAHCVVTLSVDQVILYIGAYDISDSINRDFEERQISQLIVHPDYFIEDKTFADADIGLLLMQEPVQFSSFIRPICLWPSQLVNEDVVDQTGIVVGWGRTEDTVFSTATPLSIELPIVSDITCLREDISYFYITSNRTFCVGEKSGKGPCHGDSGSGFFMKRKGRWVLRGVVSAGLPDPVQQSCDLEKYVVMSDVVKYQDWVMSYL